MQLRSSADQWQVLAAVVDAGGFTQAAERLHRSQSAVSYAIAQLQESLGVRLLEMQGRRAVLTPTGRELLRRSRVIVEQFARLEALARAIDSGWESELRLVVDAAFPQQTLLGVLAELSGSCPYTTLSLADAVLSGAEEAITSGAADVVVTTRIPSGFLGNWLMDISMVAVAAPVHPLHQLQRTLTLDDLALHTQAVVRDSGRQSRDEGWLGATHRWDGCRHRGFACDGHRGSHLCLAAIPSRGRGHRTGAPQGAAAGRRRPAADAAACGIGKG